MTEEIHGSEASVQELTGSGKRRVRFDLDGRTRKAGGCRIRHVSSSKGRIEFHIPHFQQSWHRGKDNCVIIHCSHPAWSVTVQVGYQVDRIKDESQITSDMDLRSIGRESGMCAWVGGDNTRNSIQSLSALICFVVDTELEGEPRPASNSDTMPVGRIHLHPIDNPSRASCY